MRTQTEPWERQPGESSRAYAGFVLYRDADPSSRSLRRVAAELYGEIPARPGRLRQVESWSSKHSWVKRATEWDSKLDEVRRQAQVDAIEKMKERHIEAAQALLQVTVISVERLLAAMEKDPELRLRPREIITMMEAAVRLERLSRGVPDSISKELIEGADGDVKVKVVWGDEEQAKEVWAREEREFALVPEGKGVSKCG